MLRSKEPCPTGNGCWECWEINLMYIECRIYIHIYPIGLSNGITATIILGGGFGVFLLLCIKVHIPFSFSFIFCSAFRFLSLIYSRNSALNAWRSNMRCDTFTFAPGWSGSTRDRVNVVENIGTMVLYVWFTCALLQLTSLFTAVNSLYKSSVGRAQSNCWQTAWMNQVPETSHQSIN